MNGRTKETGGKQYLKRVERNKDVDTGERIGVEVAGHMSIPVRELRGSNTLVLSTQSPASKQPMM